MVAPTAILFSLNLLFSATMASLFPLQPPPPEAPPPNTPPPNAPPPNTPPSCPLNTLQLGACAGVLNMFIGPRPIPAQCCTLLDGLVDLDAALCFCDVIRVDYLPIIHVDVPVALSLLLDACDRNAPENFQCPPLIN
ncbi:hypothetical protein Ahy_B04g069700 [Arachis hypogaea]|uniref:Bifunctional inhibitor/plant lipid transfer protein/seed storage helical domain-containing protein n=2 Tax=Arachis TaxID=3817 RepID=A0A444ZDB9_ARAHY|nr:hypothetical protein Ahy_B04g069700 [Arachis hypogaea]